MEISHPPFRQRSGAPQLNNSRKTVSGSGPSGGIYFRGWYPRISLIFFLNFRDLWRTSSLPRDSSPSPERIERRQEGQRTRMCFCGSLTSVLSPGLFPRMWISRTAGEKKLLQFSHLPPAALFNRPALTGCDSRSSDNCSIYTLPGSDSPDIVFSVAGPAIEVKIGGFLGCMLQFAPARKKPAARMNAENPKSARIA